MSENLSRSANITNQRGLHARAAAKFVKLAEQFDAEVSVSHKGQEVSGSSIMGLMMLAAGMGSRIEMRAKGAQAENALNALVQLVEDKFHEE
ncbi:MAG: serine kinase [Alphaproteobacteria bacterium RIFOXYD12_FULL_60_8]|nr:MAG: serine kinase [Alphaproteobacteria bacterium RIFOXYD12_FULL_60_8]